MNCKYFIYFLSFITLIPVLFTYYTFTIKPLYYNYKYNDTFSYINEKKFQFNFPKLAPFMKLLVKKPDLFILPPGQLWPAPESFWHVEYDAWYVKLLWLLAQPRLAQDYEPDLFHYRFLQAGLGYSSSGVDPGQIHQLNHELNELIQNNATCNKILYKRLSLAFNIFHTGENYPLQVENLEALCNDTCISSEENCYSMETKDSTYDRFIRELLGATYLRYGEEENCRLGHTYDSCLLPLKDGAIHKLKYGSENAIKMFEIQLAMDPDNIGTKWLLNIAYMTLDEYPDNVPKEYLISPDVFKSDYNISRFYDVAEGLNLNDFNSMGNVIIDDFINDDQTNLDIFSVASSYDEPVKLYKNVGDGNFIDITDNSILKYIKGGANVKQGDYNNDGKLDLFITRGGWINIEHPNTLLKNLGNGQFEDVTHYAFPYVSYKASHSSSFNDFNLDGYLDLFVANEDSACELWLNQKDGTFIDISKKINLKKCGLVKGVSTGDINNDGYPDIFLSRYGQSNKLFLNNKNLTFQDITESSGIKEPLFSFPCVIFDSNQDGWLDIYVAGHLFEGPDAIAASYTNEKYFMGNIIEKKWGQNQKVSRLYINNKDNTFTDYAYQSKLSSVLMSMAMNVGDIDNDGYEDIYHGTGQPDVRALQPNRMLRNYNGTYYQDVTTSGGFGHLQKGHGISMTDIDNDGDLDVMANMGGAFIGDYFRNVLFMNPGTNNNNFLTLIIRGINENYYGVGVRIKIKLNNGKEIYRTVSNGATYGANSLRVHAGLGNAKDGIEYIEIFWPNSKKVQQFKNIPIDSFIKIIENDDNIKILTKNEINKIPINVDELLKKSEEDMSCHHHHDEHIHENNILDNHMYGGH